MCTFANKNTLIMDIENGTWVQLKSDTSKLYCVNSVSDEFIEGVSSNGERTTLNVNEVEPISDIEKLADLGTNQGSIFF